MSNLVVRFDQFSLEFECSPSFQLKDIPEFLEKHDITTGGKKPLFVVAANGDSFCVYCLKKDEVSRYSIERIYSILNEAYPDLCQHSGIQRMKREDSEIYVLQTLNSCSNVCDGTKCASTEVEQKSSEIILDNDQIFSSPSEHNDENKPELKPVRQNRMVDEIDQHIPDVNQPFCDKNEGSLLEGIDRLDHNDTLVCLNGENSAIPENGSVVTSVIEKELLNMVSATCDTKSITCRQDLVSMRSRRRSYSDISLESNDNHAQTDVFRSLPLHLHRKGSCHISIEEKKRQLEKSEEAEFGALSKENDSSHKSNYKYGCSSLTKEEVKTQTIESSPEFNVCKVSPESALPFEKGDSCLSGDKKPVESTDEENSSSNCDARKVNRLPEQPVKRLNDHEDPSVCLVPSMKGESVTYEEQNISASKIVQESGVLPEKDPVEETAADLNADNKSSEVSGSFQDGGRFPIPCDDDSGQLEEEVNQVTQSGNILPSQSKTGKILVEFVFKCNGSCGDKGTCLGNRKLLYSPSVDVVWAHKEDSGGRAVITVEKSCSEYAEVACPVLMKQSGHGISTSVSLKDSTPLAEADFPAPVECVDNNNITRHLGNIAAGQGNPSTVVSVPTKPQHNIQLTDKAASALAAGNLAAGRPHVCVGHLNEAVVQPQQQQQSDFNYVPLQPGSVCHNVNFAATSDENRSHDLPVYRMFQGNPSEGSDKINKLSGGNYLVAKKQVDTRNQEVNSVDTSIPTTVVAEEVLQQVAYGLERSDGNTRKLVHFEQVQNYQDKHTGTVIYSRPNLIPLMEGQFGPIPTSRHKLLGRGGNGEVYSVMWRGEEYAVKQMVYQYKELNFWKDFNHPHLMSLLAVVIGPPDGDLFRRYCFQFMRRMSGSLVWSMKPSSNLLEVAERPGYDLETVSRNVLYIGMSVLQGLDYLAMKKLQHGDVKESNILVLVTCRCGGIWKCICLTNKYEVKLSDYDSVGNTEHSENPQLLPNYCCRPKTHEEWTYVTGTPGCRAPEQLVVPEFSSATSQHVSCRALCGPWCDVWSLGRAFVTLYMGSTGQDCQYIKDANVLLNEPDIENKFSARNEAITSVLALSNIQHSADQCLCRSYSLVSQLAHKCMKINFRDRWKAYNLITWIKDQN